MSKTKHTRASKDARKERLAEEAAVAAAKLQGEHVKVFLEYHCDSAWAKAKVTAGTVRYTAEGYSYLLGLVERRKEDKARADALAEEVESEKPVAQ